MSWHLAKAEMRTLNTMEEVLAEARLLDSYGGYDGEREDKERREAQIREKILSGEMTPFVWAVGHVPSLNLRRRVNGQHSSKTFLKLTEEEYKMVRYPVVIAYEEYLCETEIDVASLFEQFDQHWSARQREDYIGAHLAVHPELSERLSRQAADRAVQGLTWYLEKVEGYDRGSAHDQYELVHKNSEYETFLRFCGYGQLNLNKKLKELCHKAVVAAMFHTTRQGSNEDRDFWKTVSGGPQSILDQDCHQYKLAVFLENAVVQQYEWPARQRSQFKNKRSPNGIEMYATCLRVFAAWKKGLRLTEAFATVREQNAAEISMKLYPLQSKGDLAA
jgi:hypothetical protein